MTAIIFAHDENMGSIIKAQSTQICICYYVHIRILSSLDASL